MQNNAEPSQKSPTKHGVKKYLFVVALVVLAVLPTVPLSLTSLGPVGSGAGVLATVVAVVAVRVYGLGKGSLVALIGAVVLSIAPVGLVYPAMGTMLMVILGGVCGFAAYRGTESPFVLLSIFTGITMVLPNPLTLQEAEQGVTVTADYVLVLTALMVISTIWGILLGWLLLLKLPRAPLDPVQREVAMTYGATLALLGGAAAAVVLTWFPNTAAGWLILTIYVIVIPRAPGDKVVSAMRIKTVHRLGGTVAGVLIATAIAAVVHKPAPLFVLGIICLVVAMEFRFAGKPYWLFVIFLTPGVIFLTGYGMDVDKFGLVRLTCTVIGAILAMAALEIHRKYTIPWIVRSRERDAVELPQPN